MKSLQKKLASRQRKISIYANNKFELKVYCNILLISYLSLSPQVHGDVQQLPLNIPLGMGLHGPW